MWFLKKIAFSAILFFMMTRLQSQKPYWILLSDKTIPVDRLDDCDHFINNSNDYYDLPVNTVYIQVISTQVEKVLGISRWLNAVAVLVKDNQIITIKKNGFVTEVVPFRHKPVASYQHKSFSAIKDWQNLLNQQIELMDGERFSSQNIDGKNIRIAVFDAGFPGVNTNPAFKHLTIVKTYDFVDKDTFVYHKISHGSMVLSCLGGITEGKKMGLATGSEYLLAITEVLTEKYAEEHNWMLAAEWAYENGANIICSSLGYAFNRYFEDDMDGKTSLIAKVADIATQKGILVINAMGNLGGTNWKVLCTPADGENVLSVGAIQPFKNYHSSFSSYGPTSDFRMKPNLCACGTVVASNGKRLFVVSGTSFSTPLVAGFAACVWQMNRDKSNFEIIKELEKSGSLYPYFDYAHGYGIPKTSYFFEKKEFVQQPSFKSNRSDQILSISFEKPEKKELLYYHIENSNHYLEKYFLIEIVEPFTLHFKMDEYPTGYFLRMFYKNYLATFEYTGK